MLELKMNPPAARPGLVRRNRLLDRLTEISDIKLVVFSAPAGYGKTTLMAQWQETVAGPTAWLTIDGADHDPVVLLDNLIECLETSGMLAPQEDTRLPSGEILTRGVGRLLARMEGSGAGGWLFLDQVEQVRSQEAIDVLAALLVRLPNGYRAAVTTRSGRLLPLALLRARGQVAELRSFDLAFDEVEAKELLAVSGIDVDDAVDTLLEKTEGWPAGLYLSALAMRSGGVTSAENVNGRDFYIADYVREELLGRVSEDQLTFLRETSVLPSMSGPLCDFVLGRSDSGRVLDELESDNLLVVPMDRSRTWYRYHSLIRDFFVDDLQKTDPSRLREIHARAASWHQERGELAAAIWHAREAGDVERVGSWVIQAARPSYATGRVDTISGWFSWLQERGWLGNHPEVAALGSFTRMLEGDSGSADLLAEIALRDTEGELGPYRLLIRSLRMERGPEIALSDARAARDLTESGSDWMHVYMGAEALALSCLGKHEEAESLWHETAERAGAFEAFPMWSYALAQLALCALAHGDTKRAERLIAEALEKIEAGGLETYITTVLPYVIASRLAMRRGDVAAASSYMASASLLRPRLTVSAPAVATQSMLEKAKSYVEIADVAGARRVAREISDIIARRPRLGALRDQHDELLAHLSDLPSGQVGPSSLTAAELRLLPMLVTHLTYPEIGERLFVSRHTVKTQAMSIYRKLGVSSRGEAVERAREVGLLSV